MMKTVSNATSSRARSRNVARWIALAAASAILHVLVFQWVDGRIGLPSFSQPKPNVVTLALNAPPEPAASPMPKPKAAPAQKKKAKSHPAKRPAPPLAAPASAPEPSGTQMADGDAASVIEDAVAEQNSAQSLPTEVAASDIFADAPDVADPASTRYKVDPPPPADLKYDATGLHRGQAVYGSGKIKWAPNGSRYSIVGEASALFLTLLDFRSEGTIDEFGISPELYSEKPFRKPETNTHFHRERNVISFSASTRSYPRKGGEQDRSSVIWQLAGIGRGDPQKYAANAQIDLFVAGARDAEVWQIRIVGEEQVETGLGTMTAWHLERIPRTGSYDKKLDIWLAPQQQWYPVKLRNTERNGDYLDLSLSKLETIN